MKCMIVWIGCTIMKWQVSLNPMSFAIACYKLLPYEVKHEMYDCLDRLVEDINEITKIDAQIENFKSKFGLSGCSITQHSLKTKTPSQW